MMHLVEKDRAVPRKLEETFLRFVRAREGPALVSEQFGFEQRFRNCGAVDGDKGLAARSAGVVNAARE
jgi:hypothetical protein